MNDWLAAALRWTARVEHACGVLLAGGIGQPDPALDDLLAALLPDAERLAADGAVARLKAFRGHLAAGHPTQAWVATHGLMAWIARYRREIQHASLRATLTRADTGADEIGADADLVIVGVLPAGRRWFAHGRFLDGTPVVLVDEVRGEGDLWNEAVISALFQARVVPAEVWGRVLRLPSGHPTERIAGRVVARPAFASRPQIVAGALRPSPRPDGDRGRLRAVRDGAGVVATLGVAPLTLGEVSTWNLWKAAGTAGFDGWGWAPNGVLVGVERDLGPAFVAVDPCALPAADWPAGPAPRDLGAAVAAALGGPFAAAWDAPALAWETWFEETSRDSDVARAAGRIFCLAARGGTGVAEALAAALGRVARGEASALALLALELAAPGAIAMVPPQRLRALAMAAGEAERSWVRLVFAQVGREAQIDGRPCPDSRVSGTT